MSFKKIYQYQKWFFINFKTHTKLLLEQYWFLNRKTSDIFADGNALIQFILHFIGA